MKPLDFKVLSRQNSDTVIQATKQYLYKGSELKPRLHQIHAAIGKLYCLYLVDDLQVASRRLHVPVSATIMVVPSTVHVFTDILQ